MEWLLLPALFGLIIGIILLFFDDFFCRMESFFDWKINVFDESEAAVIFTLGIVQVLLGGWITAIGLGFGYSGMPYLFMLGGFMIFFGLMHLFAPARVFQLSKWIDRMAISTHNLFLPAKKIMGGLLTLSALIISICILR